MATFAFIQGAGDGGWYWHLVEVELRRRGHDVVARDLPDDEAAGLPEYADSVLDTIDGRSDLVVVAQSFGAFTGPLVCARARAELLVFVAGMMPAPGEPPDDWWANTGYEPGADASGDDEVASFYHDVPPELAAEALRRERAHPSARSGREPSPLDAWPDVPTRVLLGRHDRLFPPAFLRRVTEEPWGSRRTRSTPDTASR